MIADAQVAVKKVLQDKRFKNRELQIIRIMEHPNVVLLKHCFFSVTSADERFLHLVLEFIPSTVYKCALSCQHSLCLCTLCESALVSRWLKHCMHARSIATSPQTVSVTHIR